MTKDQRYSSVWDALEDDPIRRENLKLRSELMIVIAGAIKKQRELCIPTRRDCESISSLSLFWGEGRGEGQGIQTFTPSPKPSA